MAESALSFVAEKLYNLLTEEAVFLHKVRDKVQWLEDQLRWMQASLADADAKRVGQGMTYWLKQVREVAFDAEDAVDTYILKMDRHRKRCSIIRYTCIFQKLWMIHNTGMKIKQIKIRLNDISDSRTTYGIGYHTGETQQMALVDRTIQERRESAIYRDMNIFVGFEEDIRKITGILLDEEVDRRCVVSIVGMGGSGKTTLARRICNSSDVKGSFGVCCALVSVSQTYTRKRILEDIAKQLLNSERVRQMDERQLIEEVCNVLERNKYLIVLDDVWEPELWSLIQPFLPDKKNGSRVIITTRILNVAKFADPLTLPHMLNLLNYDQSWKLFTSIVFPKDVEADQVGTAELAQLGKTIVKKCGGLPLAVVVMGGLLTTKERTPSAWQDVMERLDWEEISPEGRVSMQILALSYDALPHHQKSCFLYFSCFPEDYEIDAEKLVQLWVAEGFIPDEEKKQGRGKSRTMEETAELFLEDLVQRCLIQVVGMSASRRVRSCGIHDLLLDLAVKKGEEVNFFHTCRGGAEHTSTPVPTMTRRLALHRGADDPLGERDGFATPKVRTLLLIGTELPKFSLKFVQKLELLRVLDLEGVKECVIPEAIGDIIHLRYLGLRGSRVSSIPSSVGKLRNLQTLDVYWNPLAQLPECVWQMGSLRHILCGQFSDITPGENIGKHLISLQTLEYVKAGNWIQKSLRMMTNLRCLGIEDISLPHHRALSDSLNSLVRLRNLTLKGVSLPRKVLSLPSHRHLESLHIFGEILMEDDDEEKEERVPALIKKYSSDELPPNLNHLVLNRTSLQQDPLSLLERLPCLRYLDLYKAYAGEEMVCSAGGFPQLERLELHRMPSIKRWRVEDGAMNRLQYLMISGCSGLEALPDGLQNLDTLHELVIYRMPDEFKTRLRKEEGEDWHKIQHIPIIVYLDA